MTDSRGWNRPAQEAAAEERRRKRNIVVQVLNLETGELFTNALRLMGLPEGSREWEEALTAWRDHHRQR
jgi:hypothetical protein